MVLSPRQWVGKPFPFVVYGACALVFVFVLKWEVAPTKEDGKGVDHMWKWLALGVGLVCLSVAVACDGGGGEVDCKTAPDYATCVEPLMKKGCDGAQCHGAGASLVVLVGAKATDLTAATGNIGGGKFKIVVAGDPNASLLYLKLLEDADRPDAGKGVGSKMPLGGRTFTADDIATVKLWIEKGAK
jgi:hypothetical protein